MTNEEKKLIDGLRAEGLGYRKIAVRIGISENTVKFHIRNLLQKTGCKSRGDLISVYQSSFSGQSYTV